VDRSLALLIGHDRPLAELLAPLARHHSIYPQSVSGANPRASLCWLTI